MTTTTETKPVKKSNHYFDNALVVELIEEYKLLCAIETPNLVEESRIKKLLNLLYPPIDSIVVRIINKYQFYKFSTEREELEQECRIACLTSMVKFDKTKGKPNREAFNYFSHICIKCCRMITTRQSNRNKKEVVDSELVIDSLIVLSVNKNNSGSDNVIDCITEFYDHFYSLFNKKERMQLLLQIMIHYIINVSYFSFKRSAFVKFAKAHGFTESYVRKFLNILNSNKDGFMKGLSVSIF